MAVRDGHVVKEPMKIEHGVWAEGLEKVVTISKFEVDVKEEKTVVTSGTRKVTTLEKQIPVVFLFTGHGWGHGVGMCQWGCRGMAARGFTYDAILHYYYPGTQLSVLH